MLPENLVLHLVSLLSEDQKAYAAKLVYKAAHALLRAYINVLPQHPIFRNGFSKGCLLLPVHLTSRRPKF